MTKRQPQGAGEVGDSGTPGAADHPRTPGSSDDSAASLLDRWQAHHEETSPAASDDVPDDAPDDVPDDVPDDDESHAQAQAPEEPGSADAPEPASGSAAEDEPAAATVETPVQAPRLPAEATVSMLDDARARRDGPGEPEAPLVEPTPLRARRPEPDPLTDPLPDPPADPLADPVADLEPTRKTPAAEVAPPAHRPSAGRRPKHAAPRRPLLPTDRATDSVAASRDVMDALGLADAGAESSPAPKHAAVADTGRDADVIPVDRGRRAKAARAAEASPPPGPEVGPSLNVEFPPKTGARKVIGLLLLISFAATCGAAYVAYNDQRTLTLGAAGTLLVVTLVLYAVRAASSPTLIAIRSGQLVVTRGKVVEKFDLTSRFTRIEVVGKAGRPGWKVLCGRFGRDPLVINSSMVDPKDFSVELERYRPSS